MPGSRTRLVPASCIIATCGIIIAANAAGQERAADQVFDRLPPMGTALYVFALPD